MRYELSDEEWTAIRPMPPNKPRGVPRVNDRRVLNGAAVDQRIVSRKQRARLPSWQGAGEAVDHVSVARLQRVGRPFASGATLRSRTAITPTQPDPQYSSTR